MVCNKTDEYGIICAIILHLLQRTNRVDFDPLRTLYQTSHCYIYNMMCGELLY